LGDYDEIIEALTILKKYSYGGAGFVMAENDVIIAGAFIKGLFEWVTFEDRKRLGELGWVKNDEGGFKKVV
jgi:hypothetical protein